MNSLRLVQLTDSAHRTFVAVVDEPNLKVLPRHQTVYDLAREAIINKVKIAELIERSGTSDVLNYDEVYAHRGNLRLICPFTHPSGKILITGTGLTHKASAENRQSMHESGTISDSMKMYRIGLEGGRPEPGKIGAEPEWFYKGGWNCAQSPGTVLCVPAHGDDGGEEAEIAGAYIVGPDSTIYRVGLMQGNEFSDHVLESKNYLYLASSKLRRCSLGPELVVDADFTDVPGEARIERAAETIWRGELHSGEKWMSHTLANLEHHHFKHVGHRKPGDAHIHFFGADNFSFRDRLKLQEKDEMVISFQGFGRPLRNKIHIDRSEPKWFAVKSL